MGDSAVSKLLAVILLTTIGLAGCNWFTGPNNKGGETTIICPGDRRCGNVDEPPGYSPIYSTPAPPSPPAAGLSAPVATTPPVAPTTAPRFQTCIEAGSTVTLRCGPVTAYRRCPGPHCRDGENPGAGGTCRVQRRYVWLTCPLDNGSPEPDDTAG